MDTTFLSYLLFLILATVLIVYLYQLMNAGNSGKSMFPRIMEKMMPVIFDTCPSGAMGTMPVHRVGPVINFHQTFNKYNSALGAGLPTGIPEMGWRNFFLAHYNKNLVPKQDPFAGTMVRDYLDNMDNVKNLYRECK
jgi:hypothetical protein